jgi:hypothetical protein
MTSTELLVWGIVAHILADWFLQNEWMAVNKTNWQHVAAWVHSGIHLICLSFVFSPTVAFWLAASHFLIDLRKPLLWWRKTFRQTTAPTNPATIHLAFWQDQSAHVLCLALASVISHV